MIVARTLRILASLGLAALVGGLVALFWRQPWLLAALLAAISAGCVALSGDRDRALWIRLAIPSAVACSAELVLTGFGMYRYEETGGLPFVPPWIATGWGTFTYIVGPIERAVSRHTAPIESRPPKALIVEGVLGLALSAPFGIPLRNAPWLFFALLATVATFQLARAPRRETIAVMLTGAAVAFLFEVPGIAAGAWSYPTSAYLGLPLWLPLAYAVFFRCLWLVLIGAAARDQGKTWIP